MQPCHLRLTLPGLVAQRGPQLQEPSTVDRRRSVRHGGGMQMFRSRTAKMVMAAIGVLLMVGALLIGFIPS